VSKGHLPKFTLAYDKKRDEWALEQDKTGRVIRHFESKAVATKGGVLQRAIGGEGSVKIEKMDGKYQEERTFPRSEDPKRSPG
jgi:hypothetical protein